MLRLTRIPHYSEVDREQIMSNKKFIALLCTLVLFLAFAITFVSFVSGVVFSGNNYYHNAAAIVWEYLRNDEAFIEEYGAPTDYFKHRDGDYFKHSVFDKTMTITIKVSTDKDRQYVVTALLEYPENEEDSLEFSILSIE